MLPCRYRLLYGHHPNHFHWENVLPSFYFDSESLHTHVLWIIQTSDGRGVFILHCVFHFPGFHGSRGSCVPLKPPRIGETIQKSKTSSDGSFRRFCSICVNLSEFNFDKQRQSSRLCVMKSLLDLSKEKRIFRLCLTLQRETSCEWFAGDVTKLCTTYPWCNA